jgi:hypothetical protein
VQLAGFTFVLNKPYEEVVTQVDMLLGGRTDPQEKPYQATDLVGDLYNASDGAELKTFGAWEVVFPFNKRQIQGCSFMEPRRFQATCADGLGTCNASGLCANTKAPTVQLWHEKH